MGANKVTKESQAVSSEEYEAAIRLNRKLLTENTDLKMRISFLQKELAKMKEVDFHVN